MTITNHSGICCFTIFVVFLCKNMLREKGLITVKKGVTFLILIFWMAVIFFFSSQNGTQSSGISRLIGHGIAEKGNELLQQGKSEEKLKAQVEAMQFVIRKSGHMGEYALLAVFTLLHLCCYSRKPRRFWLYGWGFCILYAVTDEIHQLFVPGREGMFQDVCIDSLGSLLGVLMFLVCYRKASGRKRK